MEKYFIHIANIKKYEEEILKYISLKDKEMEDLKGWGINHYNYEKRQLIIDLYLEKNENCDIEALKVLHRNWDIKKVTVDDIMEFASRERDLKINEENKYDNTWVNKIHRIFLGGDNND